MRKTIVFTAVSVIFLSIAQWSYAGDVDIQYTLTNLGGNHWQYTYDVTNNAIVLKVKEFTIWFELGHYSNLSRTTPNPPSGTWNEIAVQPDPLLGDDGYYDALSLAGGIDVGQSVHGFSVAFDWLGTGTPGAQQFDIINPDPFGTIYSGTTTPEPAVLAFLLIAPLLFRRRT